MASAFPQELHYSAYDNQQFQGSHAGHSSFYQYLGDPTYGATALGQPVLLPVDHPTTWNIPDTFHPTATLPPPTIFLNSTIPHATGVDFPHATVPPIGLSAVRPQTISLLRPAKTTHPCTHIEKGKFERPEDHQVHSDSTSREIVPQHIYKTPRQQKSFGSTDSIEFFVHGTKGIRLSDSLEGKWGGFEGRDDRFLFAEDRAQITLRLLFVGCPPWESKISTADHTISRQPIAREKLAKEVAKSVKRFLERETKKGHGDHSMCKWQSAMLSNIYLTRLLRVSTGSWQPELFLVQPPVPAAPATSPP